MGIMGALAMILWGKRFRYLPGSLGIIAGEIISDREEKTLAVNLKLLVT